MKIDDALSTLKNLFLDVIGYFLPGFTFLFLTYMSLSDGLKASVNSMASVDNFDVIAVILSYVMGYVLFGISESEIISLPKFFPFIRKWRSENYITRTNDLITKSFEYKLALVKLSSKLGVDVDLETMKGLTVNQVRNFAMSYVPEVDNKIYNLMYRAELSKNIATGLRIIFIIGALSWLWTLFSNESVAFRTDNYSMLAYSLCLVASFFLDRSKERFFSIAMRVVFPIFICKYATLSE